MYLVVPQLKNRLVVFYLLADDRASSRSCHFNKKKKRKAQDTSAQTHHKN